jgi:hypothetical protein
MALTVLRPTQYEPLTALPDQEVYDVENTGRRSDTEAYTPIRSSVENKQDNILQKFSTIHNPVLNGDKEFSSEFSTMYNTVVKGDDESSSEFRTLHSPIVNGDDFSSEFSTQHNPILNGDNFSSEFSTLHSSIVNEDKDFSSEFSTLRSPIVNGDNDFSSDFSTLHSPIANGDKDFSSEFSTLHNPIVNGDNDFPSEFSTIQTETEKHENRLLSNELSEVERIKQLLLTTKAYLKKTLAAKKYETEYGLNIQNLSAHLTGESPDDYSEFIHDNLINFVNANADCMCYDLSANLECLKRKFMQHIRHLIGQKALKSSDTVNLSYLVAEPR